MTDDLMEAIRRLTGRPVSPDFASDEPPMVRGGNETVYQVHTIGAVGASWQQAARFAVGASAKEFEDGRVAQVRRMGCHVLPGGAVRFSTEMDLSVKFRGNGP